MILSFFYWEGLMKNTIFFFLLIIPSQVVHATTDFNQNCRKAYHEIICLSFTDARKTIDLEKSVNPSNTIPFLLENYIEFLTVMLGEEEKDLEKMRQNKDARLQILAKGDQIGRAHV